MTTKSVDLAHLRSVVLAGHAGAGKTTLAESLLFRAGAIPRLGKVDDGTSTLDHEPEEQKRRESLSLAVATFDDDGVTAVKVGCRAAGGFPGNSAGREHTFLEGGPADVQLVVAPHVQLA